MFGLTTWQDGKKGAAAAKKSTKFMTNSRAIGNESSRKCDGSHKHQQLLDGRAARAARYADGLCNAICRGIFKEEEENTMQIRAVMQVGEGYRVAR